MRTLSKTVIKSTLHRAAMLIMCLLASHAAMADGEIFYGIYQGSGSLSSYGTKKGESYDIALHLTDPTLVGMEVRGIRIPVNTDATNATDYKVWLSRELTVVSGKHVPDILSVDVTPDGKWSEVRLAEPYVIQDGGFYAGYSFTVSSVDASDSSDPNLTPVVTLNEENPEGLLIHTSRTFRKWAGVADVGSPAIVVLIGGSSVKANAAMFTVPDNLYTTVGKSLTATLTLVNHGTEAIKNIDYEIELNGQTEAKHVSKSLAGGYYGRNTTLSVTIPAVDVAGAYSAKFRITKINGEPNEDPHAEAVSDVIYLSKVPVHKPLVEEYTGLWCQYCPRALAGMEKMSDKNGDDFVGVAYHLGDILDFTSSFNLPADPAGLPTVYIDRVSSFEPLNGQSTWEARRNIIAPASVEVVGEWADEAKTQITAISTTSFIRDFTNSPYRLGYILLVNDIHDATWNQENALSGSTLTGDAYLDKYIKAGNPIWDLHYNEVVLAQSAVKGAGLPESLPSEVKGNTPYYDTFTFSIADSTLPIDKSKLEVVVVLVNTITGEAVNCNKGHVVEATGISEISSKDAERDSEVYDLMGRRVSEPAKGLYIRNGKKIINK